MPLGQGISEMVEAVRDRVEVTGEDPVWEVTAGSFESALAYARQRFEEPVVLARRDRDRWWRRVSLTVSTDPAAAASAPPLEELAGPPVPRQRAREDAGPGTDVQASQPETTSGHAAETQGRHRAEPQEMPPALADIFDHQEQVGQGGRQG